MEELFELAIQLIEQKKKILFGGKKKFKIEKNSFGIL